jgi:hypothetical protein
MRKSITYVLAVAATALAIGVFCKSSSTPPAKICPLLVKSFTESAQIAGYYCLCWDQIPQSGDSTPYIATYELRMTAGAYKTHLNFDVQSKASPVPAVGCCAVGAVATQSLVPIPDSFHIQVNAPVYAPGDLIEITYALPAATDVQIEIYALLGCI